MATATKTSDSGITTLQTEIGTRVTYTSLASPNPMEITLGSGALSNPGISRITAPLVDQDNSDLAMLCFALNDRHLGVIGGTVSRHNGLCRVLGLTSMLFEKTPTGEFLPCETVCQQIWRSGVMGWPVPLQEFYSDREFFAKQVAPEEELTDKPLELELRGNIVHAALPGFGPTASFAFEGIGLVHQSTPLPNSNLHWECVSFPLPNNQGRGLIAALTAVEHDETRSVLASAALRCAETSRFGLRSSAPGQQSWVDDGGLTHSLRKAGHPTVTIWNAGDLSAALKTIIASICQ